ncbi:hypothetical protein GGF37_005695, partial [Kickxella alabastrina]
MLGPILPKGSADNEAALDIQTPEMLVLDMAMQREMLQLIVAQARSSSGADKGRLRAVVLLQVLVMMPQRVGRVVRAGGIETLVDTMHTRREKEVAMRETTMLLGLLDTSDAAVFKRHMRQAAGCGFLEVLSEALLQSANGLARDSSKQRQRSDAMLVSVSVSELELFRMLMESLTRLCTFLMAYRLAAAEENATEIADPQMVQLLDLGAVDIIAACVCQDDQIVSSWGIEFLHEFVSR